MKSQNDKKEEPTKEKNTKVKKAPKPKKTKTRLRPYFSFGTRLALNIIFFISFLIIGTLLLNKALIYENEEIVHYNENSNLDYKVYLLKNDFYEQPYLGKDMLYVASLIDKIALDFDYKLTAEKPENIDFNYSIVGKLTITNKEGTRQYYEKTYTLMDSKSTNMRNTDAMNIKETINIDYAYYNSLANKFKTSYGIDTDSNLTIYMIINKKNSEDGDFKLDNSGMMNIIIPLSQRSIEIKLDYKEINTSSTIVKEKGISIENIVALVISIFIIIVSIIMMLKALRKILLLHPKKSQYDKYIEKTLKEYDRLIAETTTLMSFEGKDIIKLTKFSELLDIHDNLQIPIMYYCITKHHAAYFYINHDNTVYLMHVKETDFINTKEKK